MEAHTKIKFIINIVER